MKTIEMNETSEVALLSGAGMLDVEGVMAQVTLGLETEVKLGRRRRGFRLKLRAARGKDTNPVWYLAGPDIDGWMSTGCTDVTKAKEFMHRYILLQEGAKRGYSLPRSVWLAAVLDFGIEAFKPPVEATKGQRKRYADLQHQIWLFLTFGRGTKLGDIDELWCNRYAAWRRHDREAFGEEPPVPFEGRPVTGSTIHNDLVALDKMIDRYARKYQLAWRPTLLIPNRNKGRTRWLDREELLRIIGAIRGRVWDVAQGCWKKIQVTDPVTGEARTVLALRDEAERHRRRSVGYRLFILGVGTGTRSTAMRRLRWSPSDHHGWIDLMVGELHRAGMASDPEAGKPQTPSALPELVLRRLRRFYAEDAAAGIDFVLHREDGLPYRTSPKDVWKAIVADAGLGSDVCIHVTRHTCCTMLQAMGMSVDDAAEYVGMHPVTFRRTYGHSTGNGARRVANFIDTGLELAGLPDRRPGADDPAPSAPRKQAPLARTRRRVSATTRA